ncbi:hypothetical protein L2E82_17062 [Cichorium intybus]|uniref:Uncharacterized protein n=1 Tax=Cichorium intybus TaxID=13427 RepID=A0ACB9F7W4_CICIN|nr:hypothetical protein L2E82_17062 [Cichorium intybus]
MASPQTLFVFIIFLCVIETFVSAQFTNFNKLVLPSGVTGPESAAFGGLLVNGPFTTVTDGRIMKWQGPTVGFVDFAYTSPRRTKQLCDGNTDPNMGPICERPLALSFHPATSVLYITDAFFGLLVVGPIGGLATQLVGGFKDTTKPGFIPDSTGRFLRYNPLTRQVTVLLSGLSGGGGPAVSRDGTFVLVPELTAKRISKYWLVGPKANTAEVLINFGGNPNKIKRAGRFGEFWVAVSNGYIPPSPPLMPEGVRINSNGVVLQRVPFAREYVNVTISLVQEQNGKLYVGSRLTNFIGVYSN